MQEVLFIMDQKREQIALEENLLVKFKLQLSWRPKLQLSWRPQVGGNWDLLCS